MNTLTPRIELFHRLRAEDEHDLERLFVPPPEFEARIAGEHSVIVFGASGSGKTMLCQMLRRRCRQDGSFTHLLVNWHPAPFPPDTKADIGAVRQQAFHLVDACALALAKFMATFPQKVEQLPSWVQLQLFWFIQRGLRGNPALRFGPLTSEHPQGMELLRRIQNEPVEEVIYKPAPNQLISETLPALRQLGLEGIWVMTDGLEGWAETDVGKLAQDLRAFLSALALFNQQVSFKLFLPARLEADVSRAGGVARRRIDSYRLEWGVDGLRKLVEKRLRLVLDQETFVLENLCSSPGWLDWLKRVGGNLPRHWLDQVYPLTRHYLEHNLTEPIDEEIWFRLRLQHPPRFWFNTNAHRVRVGGRDVPINDLPPKAYAMLCYLYQNSGTLVKKSELYFLVYLGLDTVPRSSGDEHYQPPLDYRGLIDTNIYRIRQVIEPDPSNPVLLQTVRGHGVKLVSRW